MKSFSNKTLNFSVSLEKGFIFRFHIYFSASFGFYFLVSYIYIYIYMYCGINETKQRESELIVSCLHNHSANL